MEKKINLVELLKNCPKGMELDCTMFDNVSFLRIQNGTNQIIICTPDGLRFLNSYGCYHDDNSAKCVIFPKGKTTWEVFQRPFKDGDVVAFDIEEGSQLFIFKEYIHNHDYAKGAKCYMMLDYYGEIDFEGGAYYVERFATEEEKQKLFASIKAHGYRWNAETKTLEKLPKFKVGDRIRSVISLSCYTIVDIEDDQYVIQPDAPEKFPYHIDFSLETNYELVHKFDINTLIPFESKVLVRNSETEKWKPAIWGYYDSDSEYDYPYEVVGGLGFSMCIPYNGNGHLMGKTDYCNDYYETWE